MSTFIFGAISLIKYENNRVELGSPFYIPMFE